MDNPKLFDGSSHQRKYEIAVIYRLWKKENETSLSHTQGRAQASKNTVGMEQQISPSMAMKRRFGPCICELPIRRFTGSTILRE
jgi:hypothetical protein